MTRLLILILLAAKLSAATTPTFTATVTPTATPGEGSWSYAVSTPLVYGGSGYSGTVSYQAGATPWAPTAGYLRILFASGFSVNASNFYLQPSQAGKVTGYSIVALNEGYQVDMSVQNLAPYDNLTFLYGYSPNGFAVNTTVSPLTLQVWAYPQSTTISVGGLVPMAPSQVLAPVTTATPTATPSATPTITLSRTFTPVLTPTPTFTPTATPNWTATVTPTFTPIGPQREGVYCYPDPFDRRIHQLVTFRYPASASASADVFRLNGDPVAKVADTQINAAQGWARWRGDDDNGRPCPGGLYFVRIKIPSGTFVRKFILFN